MNVGLIPRTQSAIVDYQRWLLPEYDGREEETSAHSGSTRTKDGATKVECFWATCYFISEIDVIGGSFGYPCRKCVTIPLGPKPSPEGTKPDGNECWKTDTCRPGGNARGDAVERRGCDGDPAASLDHCGRCVGGDTGRRAADAGADCATYAPCDLRISELKAAFPSVSEQNLSKIQKLIDKHGHAFGLNSTERVAHFLSQVAHESGGLGSLTRTENLNYTTAQRLVEVWPSLFSLTDPSKTDPTPYIRNPEALANFVYGRRRDLGNNGINSGDGWAYRGRGLIQLTGRYNYTQFNAFYGQQFGGDHDFVRNPNLLSTSEDLSVLAALWFFKTRVIDGLRTLNVDNVSFRVNGEDPAKGLEERKKYYDKAVEEITC